jgi:hypothetical protein
MPVPRAYRPLLPLLPICFDRNRQRNKALYRNFGITQRNNRAMRADDIARARAAVEDELKLELPAAIAA